jgi:RNA polymerase sigma-70 factor, ECF subfamily
VEGRVDNPERLAALLAGCAKRDAAALEELYRSTAPALLACLMRILRRRALAEEALQDVFVQVWQRAGQYDEHRGRPYAWLVSMARYRAIDILRRERITSVDPDEIAETLAADAADEGQSLASTGDAQAVEYCMQRLTGEQRECIRLAFLAGRSHPEIAASLARPLGSVKSWIRRGLAALKECIEACAPPASN